MKKRSIISYSIIRFRPYPELGEFVNVGIVAFCHDTCQFDYILTSKHRSRINNFFQELSKDYFTKAIKSTVDSLNLLKRSDLNGSELFKKDAVELFQKFTAPVESVIYYEQPSAKVIFKSFKEAINELYDNLILRQDKQTKVYQEELMAKELKNTFDHNKKLKRIIYDTCLGESKGIHLNLTCSNEQKKHSIRVLNLDKRNPNSLLVSGTKITEAIELLKDSVDFNNVLLAIHPPTRKTKSFQRAYLHVMNKFEKESKIIYCDFKEQKNILSYATENLA